MPLFLIVSVPLPSRILSIPRQEKYNTNKG
jgi:hypothetical protein